MKGGDENYDYLIYFGLIIKKLSYEYFFSQDTIKALSTRFINLFYKKVNKNENQYMYLITFIK